MKLETWLVRDRRNHRWVVCFGLSEVDNDAFDMRIGPWDHLEGAQIYCQGLNQGGVPGKYLQLRVVESRDVSTGGWSTIREATRTEKRRNKVKAVA